MTTCKSPILSFPEVVPTIAKWLYIRVCEYRFDFASRRRCTCETEHPRKRGWDHTTPSYSNTEEKFSSQTQRQKCAPTTNLGTQLTAFCARSTFCKRRSKRVAAFTLQIYLVLRVLHITLPDQDLPWDKTSVWLKQ